MPKHLTWPTCLLLPAVLHWAPSTWAEATAKPGQQGSPTPFEIMDRHAIAAPESAATTPAALAAYLCRPAANPWDKARVIFRWITEHIEYDIEAYRAGTKADSDPEKILRSRRAVCLGYANLFQRLCQESGLEAEVVLGFSREYGEPDERLLKLYGGPIGHAWNAVKLGGQWHVLDVTWGAGHIQDNQRFVREFDPHYFLTRPVELIHTHFPEDPKWQLLPRPIEREIYDQLVHVRSGFFRHGLKLQSHRLMNIDATGPLTITVGAPPDVELYARVEQGEDKLPRHHVLTQRRGKAYEVKVCLSQAGTYRLLLFSRRKENQSPADRAQWALGYQIQVDRTSPDCPGYPATFLSFHERDVYVTEPLSGRLPSQTSTPFSLTVPGAQQVFVQTGAAMIPLAGNGDRFAGKILAAPGDLVVFALFPREDKARGLLQYLVE